MRDIGQSSVQGTVCSEVGRYRRVPRDGSHGSQEYGAPRAVMRPLTYLTYVVLASLKPYYVGRKPKQFQT